MDIREEQRKVMEDLLKASKAANQKDEERRDAFRQLVKHPGWTMYVELLNNMIADKGAQLLEPANGVDRAVALEYVKGSMYGLLFAKDLPEVTIAHIDAALGHSGDSDDDDDDDE